MDSLAGDAVLPEGEGPFMAAAAEARMSVASSRFSVSSSSGSEQVPLLGGGRSLAREPLLDAEKHLTAEKLERRFAGYGKHGWAAREGVLHCLVFQHLACSFRSRL